MIIANRIAAALALPLALLSSIPAQAGIGDLLVAPTRIVLNGSRGAEVVLSNIGDEVATYRISVEFRRMKEDGSLEEVAQHSDRENATKEMIFYAPRRVNIAAAGRGARAAMKVALVDGAGDPVEDPCLPDVVTTGPRHHRDQTCIHDAQERHRDAGQDQRRQDRPIRDERENGEAVEHPEGDEVHGHERVGERVEA